MPCRALRGCREKWPAARRCGSARRCRRTGTCGGPQAEGAACMCSRITTLISGAPPLPMQCAMSSCMHAVPTCVKVATRGMAGMPASRDFFMGEGQLRVPLAQECQGRPGHGQGSGRDDRGAGRGHPVSATADRAQLVARQGGPVLLRRAGPVPARWLCHQAAVGLTCWRRGLRGWVLCLCTVAQIPVPGQHVGAFAFSHKHAKPVGGSAAEDDAKVAGIGMHAYARYLTYVCCAYGVLNSQSHLRLQSGSMEHALQACRLASGCSCLSDRILSKLQCN